MAYPWLPGLIVSKTTKGKDAVAFNGYAYFLHERPNEGADKIRYKCLFTNRCTGKLWTNLEKTGAIERGGHVEGCHPNHERLNVLLVESNMRQAAETSLQPMPQLYRQHAGPLANNPVAAAQLRPFQSYDSSLYRRHNKQYQNNPATLAEVNIPPDRQVTIHTNQRFLLYQSPTNNVIIFVTDENVRKLAALVHWAMDGMFSHVPAIFRTQNGQLWTMHAFWGNKLLPLLYCLTTSKTQATYMQVIRHLKDKAVQLGVVLNPISINCDFETGLLPALEAEFPNANVKGCHFHMCQAIYRNVQRLHLMNYYTDANDNSGRLNIRMLMASPFIPQDRQVGWFEDFVDSMLMNVRVRLQPLLDYFRGQWLERVPLRFTNMYQVERRTDNNLEGWHCGFEKRLNRNPTPGFLHS